ncbi:MAG TPA: agmatine deiminase family protein [Bacteroidota bacterium]
MSATPATLGYSLPAEWAPHEATWLGWPSNTEDWPGKFAPIPWVYGEIVRKLAPGEIVRIIAGTPRSEAAARRVLTRAGADLARVEFLRFPSDRGWTRDSGPMFLRRERAEPKLAVAGFRFNAWARYPDWKRDARIHARAAKALRLPLFLPVHKGQAVVLEGGAIDVNGEGTLVTTEECLLDGSIQVRNPDFTRQDMEEVFRAWLGVTNVIWLERGIAGDDTHGHVDDLCRFVNRSTLVLCREENQHDENFPLLAENRERLRTACLENGSHPDVVELPMPSPLFFGGRRLPASYANFYIANAAVLVPTFNDPNDRVALGILGELFADRPVVGIHAVDLVWGLGTLHCLSHEQPRSA